MIDEACDYSTHPGCSSGRQKTSSLISAVIHFSLPIDCQQQQQLPDIRLNPVNRSEFGNETNDDVLTSLREKWRNGHDLIEIFKMSRPKSFIKLAINKLLFG